jgi:serine/threonine protein kinase
MKIEILNPDGVHQVEKEALVPIGSSLPNTWLGYSSLEMLDRWQGSSEIDLIVVNDFHILIVELKRIHGDLTSDGNYWYKNNKKLYKSPVKVNELKAKKLKSKIQDKLKTRLPRIPYVTSCVVIYGKVSKQKLQEDEKDFVLTLEEFLKIGSTKVYSKCFGLKDWEKRIPKDQRPNATAKIWNQFFGKNKTDFIGRDFSVLNYVVTGKPLFTHPEKIYREYYSQRSDDKNYRGLIRRWDFSAPSIANHAQTDNDRMLIGYRESKVLGYIDNEDEDLRSVHLPLKYIPEPDDITVDFAELYEWPKDRLRLDEFIHKYGKKLSSDQKIDIVQIFLSHIARLHNINVAHRDLGKHSLWLALPSKVTISNFVTASYPDPDNKTMVSFRSLLQVGQAEMPEDLFGDDDGTQYTRDVYLAAACAHFILYLSWPGKDDDGIYYWSDKENDIYDGEFNEWFSSSLNIEAAKRFENMEYALKEFNEIVKGNEHIDSDVAGVNEVYVTSTNVWVEYQPVPVTNRGTMMLLRSSDEKYGIKLWNGVSHVTHEGEPNHNLALFLKRVQAFKSSSLPCLLSIEDIGYNPGMQNLFVVYQWCEGITWKEWLDKNPSSENIEVAQLSLLNALIILHQNQFRHGDIHPGNIIVHHNDESLGIRFIDILEYSHNNEPAYEPIYTPDNYKSLDVESRDRYAVIKIIYESSQDDTFRTIKEATAEILKLPEISSGELTRLLNDYEQLIRPEPAEVIREYNVTGDRLSIKGSSFEELVADENIYYLTCKLDTDRERNHPILKIFLSGLNHQLDIYVDPSEQIITKLFYKEINHGQFIRNKRNSDVEVKGRIRVSRGIANTGDGLIEDILEVNKVRELITVGLPELAEVYREKLSINKVSDISTRQLWKVLVETEQEIIPKVSVDADPEYLNDGDLIVQFSSDTGAFDFDLSNDTIIVKKSTVNGLKVLGRLSELTRDILRITNLRGNFNLNAGDEIYLESSLSSASLNKRLKAVDELLKGRCLIPDLPDYFDRKIDKTPVDISEPPTDDELDYYNEYDDNGKCVFSLNRQQRDSFKKLYSKGPVSLLQGPPGTGKTAFIGSFVHYALEKGASKILLVSQSHEAVNNAGEKVRNLFESRDKAIQIVRLGDEGNVSNNLKDVHELALQDHYREKFRAEYAIRLRQSIMNFGLPEEFINDVVEFESSFGEKIDIYSKVMADTGLSDKLQERIKKFSTKVQGYFNRKSIKVDTNSLKLDEFRDYYYEQSCIKWEVSSARLIDSMKQLIHLANEWLTVMSSRNANFQNFLAKTRTLVCGTCVGIGRTHYGLTENTYDWVVIDEAARSSASELAIAMRVGRRVLLVGDHKQLPALYQEDHLKATLRKLPKLTETEIVQSDFERSFHSNYGRQVGQTLLTQYRMSPIIGKMVSDCYYGGLLQTGRAESAKWVQEIPEKYGQTITWIDTSDVGEKSREQQSSKGGSIYSKSNAYEIKAISQLVEGIVSSITLDNEIISDKGQDPLIGIICMYGQQKHEMIRHFNMASWSRQLIEKRLIKIDTVDSYQGKENSIIIVSLVRNNPRMDIGFLSEGQSSASQRSNVALSRAKERLYLVGSTEVFSGKNTPSPIGRVLSYINDNHGNNISMIASKNIMGK